MSLHWTRRQWLAFGAAQLAAPRLLMAGPPPVNNPRATDGDERFEPKWDERLTVTVGHEKADLNGRDDKVIQAALDYVARLGGGTVLVKAGKYVFRNAVHLPSRVRLRGEGPDTILTKIPSVTTPLAADSDWYDQEVTLSSEEGFRVGDGVVLITKNPHNGATDVIKRTLVAKSGKRFKLSDGIRKNLWLTGKPACSSMFPLLTSEYTADVVIENLALDGDKKNNMNLNGNYAGNIFLQDCNRYTIRDVESREYNGDGISFQICHDVVVENCYSHDNANLGVHPGSGSQRPVLKNNRLERNDIGIFWCWGVKYGLAEGNRILENRNYGISIGHCDTDNVMRNNEVIDSGKVGILFRDDPRGRDFWANRNLIENNTVINSGPNDGVAIDIQGQTKDTKIRNNRLVEKRGEMKRVGLRIADKAGAVELADNQFEGFATDLIDARKNK